MKGGGGRGKRKVERSRPQFDIEMVYTIANWVIRNVSPSVILNNITLD